MNTTCTPAHEVYGGGYGCLPHTGADPLWWALVGLLLILAGVAVQVWLRRSAARQAEDDARRRFYGGL